MFRFRCGINPRIWEMTGSDADILCGEWDSNGNTDPSTSGERFNIALTIKEIVRHPDYRNNLDNEQSYLQNDIAIFKVDENALSKVTVIDSISVFMGDGTMLLYKLNQQQEFPVAPLSVFAGGD